MTETKLIQDNKLIAQFMNLGSQLNMTEHPLTGEYIPDDELEFNSSKKWLKKVIDKIEDILFENIGEFGYFDDCLYSKDFEARYIAVVEFINWYNNLKKA